MVHWVMLRSVHSSSDLSLQNSNTYHIHWNYFGGDVESQHMVSNDDCSVDMLLDLNTKSLLTQGRSRKEHPQLTTGYPHSIW